MLRKLMTATAMVALATCATAQAADSKKAEERAAAEAARTAQIEENKRLGSLYLRCDGQPNNMGDAEAFGRLIALSLVVGLLAPAPETADPAKRLFGDKGVEACSKLIDDADNGEHNGLRRIPLILARAIHRIEAKDYSTALGDIEKARGEAQALGLVGNPYFDRSMGLSFDQLESIARLRLDDPKGAEEASLRSLDKIRFSLIPLVAADSYDQFLPEFSSRRERQMDALARLLPGALNGYAARLEEVHRFTDAAEKREAYVREVEGLALDDKPSLPYATAALSHALAGDWTRAEDRFVIARDNLAARSAAGKAEQDASTVVEVLDLVDVLRLARDGKLKEARRNFAARSQWLSPGFGAVAEANRRLRQGAAPDELFGGLAKTPEQLWTERRDQERARRLRLDSNNKTLFTSVFSYARIGEYERASKNVWRTVKPKMMGTEPLKKSGQWMIYGNDFGLIGFDAEMLHAALEARAKGKQGFTIGFRVDPMIYGVARFTSPGEKDADPSRYVVADDVIAELGALIPSPEVLAERKKAKK